MRNILFRFKRQRKEVTEMMAMLWAQKVILGKKDFTDVPRLLRDQVREILIESGLEDLTKTNE